MDRAFGNLYLVAGPGSTIDVNAPLGSPSTGSVSMNAGAGGTVTIGAGVTASGNVSVIADTIHTSQAVTSAFSSVSLRAAR